VYEPAECDSGADPGIEELGCVLGERHFPGGRGVAAVAQRQHRLAVWAVRVLVAYVERLDRAGHGDRRVGDHIDGAEPLAGGGDARPSGLLVGTVEADERLGVAVLTGRVGRGVDGDRRAGHGGADGDRQQRQHQYLLAPLPTEQPERPPQEGPAPRTPAVHQG
jgi:hypothetical protein